MILSPIHHMVAYHDSLMSKFQYSSYSAPTLTSKSDLNSVIQSNYSLISFHQSFHQIKTLTFFDIPINYSRQIICPSHITMADFNSRVSVENDGDDFVDPCCTEVIVIRHGETDWNAIGKMQGQLDVELNEIGRRQAVAVADRLSREPNVSAVYSSDLKRALETAETIASRCGGLQVIRDQGLRERHLGDLQGIAYHELAKLNPKAHEAFKSQRSDQEIPGGGESRDQLYERSTSVLQRIGEKHRGQRVIVVSHGGVIRSLYNRAAAKGQHPGRIQNTSVGIIQLSDGDLWSVKIME